MHRVWWVAVLAAGSYTAYAQSCNNNSGITPYIGSLQSDAPYTASPGKGAAITVGTSVDDGAFWLYINGNFDTTMVHTVTWTSSLNTPSGASLSIQSVTPTQIIAWVDPDYWLYADTVSVQVLETPGGVATPASNIALPVRPQAVSCAATFAINPVMSALSLSNGAVGQSYSQPLATGGTGPYTIAYYFGTSILAYNPTTPVPGMSAGYITGVSQQNTNFNGTPTTAGQYGFLMSITDAWGNNITPNYAFTVAAPPTITSLSQNAAAVGSCTLLTINGANFTNGATALLELGPNNVVLPTTFVSSTQLTVQIPPADALAAGTLALAVQGTSGAPNFGTVSTTVPFTFLSPVITSISPSAGTAGAPAGIALTVLGQNFVANSAACPAVPSEIVFGATPLTNVSFVSGGMTATLPALPASVGPINVVVVNKGTAGNLPNLSNTSNAKPFTVSTAPTASTVTPRFCTASTSATAGCTAGAFPIQIAGTSLVTGDTAFWDTTGIGGTIASSGQITVSVPHNLLTVGTHQVAVMTPDGVATNRLPFVVYPAPVLTSVQPPSVIPGTSSATLTLTGANFLSGMKVQWQGPAGSAVLIPTSLTATQIVVTVPGNLLSASGTATVVVPSLDVIPVPSNPLAVNLAVPQPALSVTTASPLTPTAIVGVLYSNTFAATGGQGAYTFSVAGGSTDGITLQSSGLFQGTPASPGTFTFTVQVADDAGDTATKGFSLLVKPAPLTITTPPFGSVALRTALSTTFTATGGTMPYSFSSSGTLPPGTAFGGATLSGTVNTPGTFSFSVTVTDSTGTTATQGYSITVTGTPLSITTTSPLASGNLGVNYSVQFQAAGGTAPYSWTAGTLPAGLTFSGAGVLSGTPNAAGTFTIGVRVTDSAKATASGSFAITISAISITTASLADGTVGSAYSGTMAASGGVGGLTWTSSGLPGGITLSSGGVFSGTPTAAGASSVSVTVTDSVGNTASRSYTLTVNGAPLTISVAGTVPASVTVGSNVSFGFSAAGGSPPYTFSATGLPAGLAISASTGTISGAPSGSGTATVSVTVTDHAGVSASTSFTLTATLPSTPPVSFTGVSTTVNPGSQSSVGVSVGSPYPVDLTVKLTLTFSGTDPAIQFATGGTTATLTIPAGQSGSLTTVGVQTGTVAGTITITAQILAGTQDITPSPAPILTITVPTSVPVISSITATRNSSGFTVTITGYSSTLALTTANFQFTGTNLETTTLSIPVSSIFGPYFQTSPTQFGSNFIYTQPFTTTNPQAVTAVTVTLVNGTGTSAGATANLQ